MWLNMNGFLKRLLHKELPEVSILLEDYTQRVTLRNNRTKEKILLVDEHGKLVNFTHADINFDRVNQLENNHNAALLSAPYGFHVDGFSDGVALVSWTLYPDGRYFEDEDGFGGENCNETTVYGFIDTHGKVLVPFQDMDRDEMEQLRHLAQNICSSECIPG